MRQSAAYRDQAVEGTIAGILSGFLVAVGSVAMAVHQLAPGFVGSVAIARTRAVFVITVCAFVGSYIESIIGSLCPNIANGAMNFMNTAIGALLFWIAWHFVPMFGFHF